MTTPSETALSAVADALRNHGIPLAQWLPSGKAGHLSEDDYRWLAESVLLAARSQPAMEGLHLPTLEVAVAHAHRRSYVDILDTLMAQKIKVIYDAAMAEPGSPPPSPLAARAATEGLTVERLAAVLRALDPEDWPAYGYKKSAAAILRILAATEPAGDERT